MYFAHRRSQVTTCLTCERYLSTSFSHVIVYSCDLYCTVKTDTNPLSVREITQLDHDSNNGYSLWEKYSLKFITFLHKSHGTTDHIIIYLFSFLA